MNKSDPTPFKEQINTFCLKLLEDPNEIAGLSNYQARLQRWLDFHNSYKEATAAILQRWAENYTSTNASTNKINRIEAESVVVEVIDQTTGQLFRRNLPINYLENSNGLLLSGETLEGKPAQLAFLSETALTKITDLRGQGPDTPRCKD